MNIETCDFSLHTRISAIFVAEILSSIQLFKHLVDGIGVSTLTLKRVSQSNEALTNQPVFFWGHSDIDIILMFEHLPSLLAV